MQGHISIPVSCARQDQGKTYGRKSELLTKRAARQGIFMISSTSAVEHTEVTMMLACVICDVE